MHMEQFSVACWKAYIPSASAAFGHIPSDLKIGVVVCSRPHRSSFHRHRGNTEHTSPEEVCSEPRLFRQRAQHALDTVGAQDTSFLQNCVTNVPFGPPTCDPVSIASAVHLQLRRRGRNRMPVILQYIPSLSASIVRPE